VEKTENRVGKNYGVQKITNVFSGIRFNKRWYAGAAAGDNGDHDGHERKFEQFRWGHQKMESSVAHPSLVDMAGNDLPSRSGIF